MSRRLVQIVESERPDGWKEAIVTVEDTESGQQYVGRTEWYYEGDRGIRIDYLLKDLLG